MSRGERARRLNCIDDTETLLGGRTKAIHLMDREGDFYALLAGASARQCELVVRSFQDRVLVDRCHFHHGPGFPGRRANDTPAGGFASPS